jgi:D-amino-acid dehydrogenase
VQSYSISLPIREPLNAPRSALFDMTNQVSITRNGARIRVSGGAELGNVKGVYTEKSIRALYASLQHYFPGAANYGPGGQTWRGNSLYSSDSLPLIGATPMDGVYLNMAHGNNGWGMACGAARLVAELIAQKATAVDASPFSPLRFRD